MKKTEKAVLAVFLMISLICGKYLFDYWMDSFENRGNYSQIQELAFPEETEEDDTDAEKETPGNSDGFDYQALSEINADCVGWLQIDGTDLHYPIVQGSDNEFYLHHDFYRNESICGTLMLDCRNDVDKEQEHLIIYGHQMKDGSMFKQLNGYKKKEFYRDHKEITLFLGDQRYQYEVAAVYVTNLAQSGGYYDFLHRETRKQQMDYLQQMAAYQLYPTGITVREEDELLSLSTCEYSSTNGRLIVLARRRKD